MQPAIVPLQIVQGATLRESIRVMQSQFEFKPIAGISSTAPVRLDVAHGLPMDWPVWVQGVQKYSELNRATNQTPYLATVIDSETLELNAVNGEGRSGSGGMLIYHPPVDLTGATAVLQVFDEKFAVLLELTPVVHAGGWIEINLSAEQTAELTWRKGSWRLNATLANGDIAPLFAGPASVVPPGTAPLHCDNSPSWVFTFGTQGLAGAGADLSEIYARLEAMQQQIDDLIAGGGGEPSAVYSAGKWVVSDGKFVVSSGVH